MKKLAMVGLLLLVLYGFAQSQTITVTSPNGGENWDLGSTHSITWRSSGVSGNVNIHLFNGTHYVGVIKNNVAVSAGTLSWVVGNYQGGAAAPGTNYKVRVRKPQTEILDDSDGPFAISGAAPSASLSVTSPNGGETWHTGIAYEVRWTSSGISGNVTIQLKKGGAVVKSWTAENTGSSYWNCSGVPDGNDYKIRVANADGSVSDESDRNFTIQTLSVSARPELLIRVESPNGGETWTLMALGDTATVRWTSSNITGDVKVMLKKGGSSVKAQTVANTGSTSFSFAGVSAGNDYKIRVENSNGSVFDESDGFFTIQRRALEAKPVEGKPVIRPLKITSFNINNGAERTNNITVTLNNSAMGSPTHYRIEKRRTRTRYWTDWFPYNTAPTTDLEAGNCGEEMLRFQVKNETSESEPVADSIVYFYNTERTILIPEAMRYAEPQGFTCRVTWTDCGPDCARIIIFPREGYQFELGYPFDPPKNLLGGMKADFELLGGGKLLKPGWEFVSFGMPDVVSVGNPDALEAQGVRIIYQPPAGGRDIKLQMRLWRNILSGAVIFFVRTITLKGPCTEEISEAFKQQ
jgi:hypothetical protein